MAAIERRVTGFGYRVFVVAGDKIVATIAQKTFNDFYLNAGAGLKEYGGTTVDVAMAFYETVNRRPARLFKVDGLRFKVTTSGTLDEKYHTEALQLAASSLDGIFSDTPRHAKFENVVDAARIFNKKRREARHAPKISNATVEKIIQRLGL